MSDSKSNQQPEALASFAQAARNEQKDCQDKSLTADSETQEPRESNSEKHAVATELLNRAAHGETPDPAEAGVHALHDRIIDTRSDA